MNRRWLEAGLAVSLLAAMSARRRWLLVTVRGNSMSPTLRNGERILARRLRGRMVRSSDIVVFQTPRRNGATSDTNPAWRVKRVAAVAGDALPGWLADGGRELRSVPPGHVAVAGDNPHSEDSRQLGFIPLVTVVGFIPSARVRGRAVALAKDADVN